MRLKKLEDDIKKMHEDFVQRVMSTKDMINNKMREQEMTNQEMRSHLNDRATVTMFEDLKGFISEKYARMD